MNARTTTRTGDIVNCRSHATTKKLPAIIPAINILRPSSIAELRGETLRKLIEGISTKSASPNRKNKKTLELICLTILTKRFYDYLDSEFRANPKILGMQLSTGAHWLAFFSNKKVRTRTEFGLSQLDQKELYRTNPI